MLDLIKKHLAAFSAGNWNEYKAGLASDVTYEEFATRQSAKGADEYVNTVQRWKRAFPDAKANVLSGFESGDKTVVELEWEGTHTGPFEGPFGAIPPTNRHGKVKAIIVSTVKNGKITETRHYFDLLTLMMQLGIAPMAGAGAQPPAKPAEAPTRH